MEKEYTIKLNIEISGVVIGENRQEAIEDIDMLDFIDEAVHSGNFTIKETDTKLTSFSNFGLMELQIRN